MDSNIKTGDFFSLQNSVESVNESDYEKTGLIIEAARAFERSTYQCVYIIDYFKRDSCMYPTTSPAYAAARSRR